MPNFTVNGISNQNSSFLDQRQWEDTYFGIASLQKSYQNFNLQLSGFARYSDLSYQPDALGDLLYNGIAPWAKRTSFAVGAQADASWKIASNHTIRGGFLVQRERVTSFSQTNALPLVPDPSDPDAEFIPGEQTVGFSDGSELVGWTYSVYLQDEWKVTPTLTMNFGARFDAISAATTENQLSPRVNLVWEPDPKIALRAGYSRYFVPAPLNQVGFNSIAVRAGTTAATEVTRNDPVRAERSDYFDIGLTVKPVDGLTAPPWWGTRLARRQAYEVPNIEIDAYGTYTNSPPCGVRLEFGAVQACYAYESQMDRLARPRWAVARIRDPAHVLQRRLPGSLLATGAGDRHPRRPWRRCCWSSRRCRSPGPSSLELRPDLHEHCRRQAQRRPPHGEGVRRGSATASGIKNICFSEEFDDCSTRPGCRWSCSAGSPMCSYTAAAEVGQGLIMVKAQIAQAELGIDRVGPAGPGRPAGRLGAASSASRQSYVTRRRGPGREHRGARAARRA